METSEGGGAIRSWNHTLSVAEVDGASRYVDRIVIDAGPMTGAAARFAESLYAYRQRRLGKLLGSSVKLQTSPRDARSLTE